MMKRFSLKGLRLSAHQKDSVHSADDFDEVADYEQPRPLTDQEDDEGLGQENLRQSTDEPGTPKKREKKSQGFFRTLKRKLTGNFRGKRESVSGVVVIEDDSSSENRDDGSLHCTRAFHSPHRPRHADRGAICVEAKDEAVNVTAQKGQISQHPDEDGDKLLRGLPKEDVSKSEEESSSPTEEEKVQTLFPTDAEYGHASAPFNVSIGTTPPSTATSNASDLTESAQLPVICVMPLPDDETSTADLPDLNWPLTPAPPPPPAEMDSLAGGSSDSEAQGACAPRTDLISQEDLDDLPLLPPPPPPMPSTSSQGEGYETYDSSERSCRGHLALVGGGINDPQKLLPVYDQLKEPPKSWSLTKELFKLSKFGWYWGPITRVEAEAKLFNQTDGAFLVRDSSDERHLLSLSFRSYGRTLHTRIEHCNGVFSFYAQPESEGYYSIVDLIEHSMNDSQTGVFCYSRARTPGSPSFPVRLTKPVSRFTQVRSLQYLCRFVIRQYTRFDHIQKLPLPPSIKGWLEENQY